MEFNSILQFLSSLTGIIVAGGLLFHPRIRGWKAQLAVTLLFLSIGTIDIGLKFIIESNRNFLHHRLLFLFLALCTLTWSIRSWRESEDSREVVSQFLIALVIAHVIGLMAYVVPYWWFESYEFMANHSEQMMQLPAVILSAISFLMIHALSPKEFSLSRFLQELAAVLLAGLVFSLLHSMTGITVMGFDQIVKTTMLFSLFAQLILSCTALNDLMESKKNDEKLIFQIRNLEKKFRVIQGGQIDEIGGNNSGRRNVEDLPRV